MAGGFLRMVGLMSLANEWFWDDSMRKAGFRLVTWSDGTSLEARTLRLITGFPADPERTSYIPARYPTDVDSKSEILLYKRKDGTPLFADIY
jgi:hypothetical protein